ncbi:Uncharacterised protein [Vibrio cholerae]|nr:Uncharacterised protein [Vibrio cholerae]
MRKILNTRANSPLKQAAMRTLSPKLSAQKW